MIISDQTIGLLLTRLIEEHCTECWQVGERALEVEGPDDVEAIEAVGGDLAHLSVTLSSGREFRVLITEV